MTPGLELAAKFAGQNARQIRVTVKITVAHPSAVHDQAVVQQGAVAIRGGFEPLEEVVE